MFLQSARLGLLLVPGLALAAGPARVRVGEQGVQLQPGLYRTVFEQAAGGQKPISETHQECMTAEDLKTLGRGFLDADEVRCKISEHKKTDGKETFVATCTDEDGQRSRTTGELTGGGEAFRFVMTVAADGDPPVTMSWTGRWIGACRK